MVTSLPSFSLCISPSLSLSHRMYLTHNIGNASAFPIISDRETHPQSPSHTNARRFRLPSLHILHVRCKFCVIRAVGRNLQFLDVWARFAQKINSASWWSSPRACPRKIRTKSTMVWKEKIYLSRSGGERTRSGGERTRSGGERTRELHTSTNLRSLDHERGEHTTRRLWSGRGLGQSHTNLRRSKALRWSVRLSIVDTSFCSGPDSADIVKTSLLACS